MPLEASQCASILTRSESSSDQAERPVSYTHLDVYKRQEEVLARNASSTLEQLFSQIQAGEVKELNLIIKGDVQGSVGALVASLEKLNNENVKVNIIHTGVGTVTESDVMLAGTSGAIIIGFNVRPSTAVQTMADRDNIQIRTCLLYTSGLTGFHGTHLYVHHP